MSGSFSVENLLSQAAQGKLAPVQMQAPQSNDMIPGSPASPSQADMTPGSDGAAQQGDSFDVETLLQQASKGRLKYTPPPAEESTTLRGVARNVGAGMSEGAGGALNVLSNPVGNLIFRPLTTLGAAAYDAVAPHLGWNRLTPEQRADLTGDNGYQQPGTALVSTADKVVGGATAADVPVNGPAERIARKAAGAAVAGAAMPVAGAVATPVISSVGAITGDQAAQAVPEWAQPAAELAGNVVGASGAVGAGRGTAAVSRSVGNRVGILGIGGKQDVNGIRATGSQINAAGRQVSGALGAEGQQALSDAATAENRATELQGIIADPATPAADKAAAQASLQQLTPQREQIVPGSMPTTAQIAPTPGAVALEKAHRVGDAAPFIERAQQQNSARLAAVQGLAPEDARPGAVGELFRRQLDQIDAAGQGAVSTARQGVQAATEGLGGQAPAEAGQDIRGALGARNAAAKQRENALWEAIDPDGKLALPLGGVQETARGLLKDIAPQLGDVAGGQETQILNGAAQLPDVVPFRYAQRLRSNIGFAERALRAQPGNDQSLRRLGLLKSSLDDAISQAAETAAQDDPGVAGRIRQISTPPQSQSSAPAVGDTVFTPSGRQIGVRYRVVDANDLTASHTDDLRPNPAYPAELQPRDRGRSASQGQVQRISTALQPERLGASNSAMEGAPIVGPGGVVESGNARVLGIRRAYAENGPQAQAYRDYLQSQGYDATGIEHPVLVRERTTELSPEDRVRFTQEANASPGLAMSAAERAKVDAQRLPDSALSLWRPGDVDSAANRDFVRTFIRSVPEKGEEGGFLTPEGGLSLEGAQRVRNALLHKAYGDPNLVSALSEVGDENIKAFGGALMDASGDMARLRADIAAGSVSPDVDVTPHLLDAARIISQARQRRVSLRDMVGQNDMLSGGVNPLTESVLRAAYGDNLTGRISRQKMAELLSFYAEEARKQTTGPRLFGENSGPGDILAQGRARGTTAESVRSKDIFGRSGGYGPGNGQAGGQVQRFVAGPEGQANAATARAIEPEARAGQELTPNFDSEAAAAYASARQATLSRKQTFGQGPVGRTLQPGQQGADYRLAAAEVPRQFLTGNAVEPARVQQYIQAVGGEQQAVAHMRDALVGDLREKGIVQPDGTIKSGAYDTWVQRRGRTIDLFPGLRDQLGNAGAAQMTLDDVTAAHKAAVDEFNKSAAAKFINDDPAKAVASAFGGSNPTQTFTGIMRQVRGNPDAEAGLRRAVVDFIVDKTKSATPAGETEDFLKAATFRSWVRHNNGPLKALFGGQGVQNLDMVAADLRRQAQMTTATPGSDTVQKAIAARRHGLGAQGVTHMTALAVIGEQLGDVISETLGGGGITGKVVGASLGIGSYLFHSLRQAGISTVNDLVREAMLHPDVARELMARAQNGKIGPVAAQRIARSLQATIAANAMRPDTKERPQ